MRRAQRRLRQLGTIVAIAIFVAGAAIANVPRSSATAVGMPAVGQLNLSDRREPGGIRWRPML